MRSVVVAALLLAGSLAAAASTPQPNPGRGFSSISNSAPAWSPDGKRIAFSTSAFGRAQIAVVDAAGTSVRRMTHDGFNDFQPRFRPDGTLVFSGQDAGANFVATLDRNGRTVKLSLPGDAVDFSPDGKRIVYQVRDERIPQYQLWVANADGSEARMLVANANQDDPQPRWSPDGTRIAYVVGANTEFRTIHVIEADGENDHAVTSGGHEWQPAWSPDGRRIAYAEGPFTQPHYSLAVVNANGSGTRPLTKPAGWSDSTPAWSPNGRFIAFTSTRSGREEIWLMRADGSQQRRLTYGGCTRIGTTGADRLVGGAGRDVLCGFAGDDLLRGGGGDDRLVGGPGADRLEGGPGRDVLLGEQGDDTLVAGAGVYTLRGGRGSDTAFADRRDTLSSIEDPHGGGRIVIPTPLPTVEELERTTRAAVTVSRASIVSLRVRIPGLYSLAVRADDPAAYLKHRINGLLLPVHTAIGPFASGPSISRRATPPAST